MRGHQYQLSRQPKRKPQSYTPAPHFSNPRRLASPGSWHGFNALAMVGALLAAPQLVEVSASRRISCGLKFAPKFPRPPPVAGGGHGSIVRAKCEDAIQIVIELLHKIHVALRPPR